MFLVLFLRLIGQLLYMLLNGVIVITIALFKSIYMSVGQVE